MTEANQTSPRRESIVRKYASDIATGACGMNKFLTLWVLWPWILFYLHFKIVLEGIN